MRFRADERIAQADSVGQESRIGFQRLGENSMATPSLGFAIPQLPSGDIDITGSFFVDKLGFEIVSRFPEQKFLIVRRGAAEIHFWQAPNEEHAKKIGHESS